MKKMIKLINEYNLSELSPIILLRESNDNKVFVVGRRNKKILRISKRLPLDDVEFELSAIQLLSKEGIPAPQVIPTRTGELYTLIDKKVAVVFEFLNGHSVSVDKTHLPSKKQAFNAGVNLGLMSNIAQIKTSQSKKTIDILRI